jgi:TetR/AcrR family transcriptional repressor of nem operon
MRKSIVRTARELILTRSYLGLSFEDLADRVGIRKASLFHHFPSKAALGIEVVMDSLRLFEVWQASVASLPPDQQAAAYVKMFRDVIGAGKRACPVGAIGGNWDSIEPELQKALKLFYRAHVAWLIDVAVRRSGKTSQTATASEKEAARQWAAQVAATCQGAMINARVQGDPAVFDAALAPLLANLGEPTNRKRA